MKKLLVPILLVASSLALAAQGKPIITVLDFKVSGISAQEMKGVIGYLSNALFKTGKYTVIDVTQRDTLLKEMEFSTSGCTDESCQLKIGKMLTAAMIVVGDITKLGSRYILTARMLETESAETVNIADGKYASLDELVDDLTDFGKRLAGMAGAAQTVTPSPAKPVEQPKVAIPIGHGSIRVEAKTSGLVYVDGKNMGDVAAGSAKSIAEVEAGVRSLEVRYADGQSEKVTVIVQEGTVVSTGFVYVRKVELPDGMVPVKGGAFRMGSDTGDSDEKPVHEVRVSDFFMAKNEVNQKEWREIMGTNPSKFIGDNLPAENLSWYDAVEYCNRKSVKEGLTPCYTGSGTGIKCNFAANGYRLPTEAEWEYAARGGAGSPAYTYAGSNDVNAVAWYGSILFGTTHPVGTKAPNALGLYDMSGNVGEWCWDWYGSYAPSSQTDPRGAVLGSRRVNRGGDWNNLPPYARAINRESDDPAYRSSSRGFRLLRSGSP